MRNLTSGPVNYPDPKVKNYPELFGGTPTPPIPPFPPYPLPRGRHYPCVMRGRQYNARLTTARALCALLVRLRALVVLRWWLMPCGQQLVADSGRVGWRQPR